MTFEEHRGPIKGRVVAWCGDGNNMAASWIQAAVRFDFELRLACPKELMPPTRVLDWAATNGGRVKVTDDVMVAAEGADCVVTDVWISMSDERDTTNVHNLLAPYQVNGRVMAAAA